MRVIHFADLHIGVETYGRPLAEFGWSSRMQDFLDALDALVAYALSEGVDAVIFAGDAYKAREPSQTHQREFARRIRRLSEAGIATFLLTGNHDLPNAEGKAHALEIFRTLDVPNVTVADNDWFARNGFVAPVLQTRAGPLQVPFLPWPQVSKLLAVDSDVTNMTIEQVHAQVEQKMSELIRMQAEALDPAIPAVLACHVSMNDWLVRERAGSEQWMTVGTAPTLLKSELHDGYFDYIALGHHHNNMQLELRTPTWYAGSMQPVDFGEENQAKGFMVFDIDPAAARGARIGGSGLPRLEKVPARRFVTVEVSPRDADPTPEVCRAVEAAAVKNAIVRVHVKMSQDQQAAFRAPEVRRMLDEAHYVAGVHLELPDERRTGLPAGVQPDAADPVEVLDTYLKLKNTDDARRARLLTVARDFILEVETAGA
ncbi:MAG: exonuclease SbcCD subunit D [Chloroflexi bacterium]|nr:exonuclease SbcCD subunit D [Chloroflexota bacterium]